MEFKNLQSKVLKTAEAYGKKYGFPIDLEFTSLKLVEEVGEFYQALLIHLGKCRKEKIVPEGESKAELAKELADVVGLAMVTADVLDIDLEKAIKEKWIKHLAKQ